MADILPPAPVDAPFASYNWADWYKKVRDAINAAGNVSHNTLTGLQGGGGGDYYHLNATQYSSLASLITEQWTYVKLGSDYSTSSTSAVDIPGLTFTPDPSKTYVVEAFLLVESNSTTTGVKPGVAWPTGLTNGAAKIDVTNSATGLVYANINYSGSGSASGTDWPVANQSFPATIAATFITGASPSGSFKLTLASE